MESAASASGWEIQERAELRGLQIEWLEPGRVIVSRRNRLYQAASLEDRFEPLATLPVPAWKRAVAQLRLGQRALRQLFYNVIPLDGERLFVTYDRSVGCFEGGRFRPVEGLARPCRVLRGSAAVDAAGDVYFGEYLPNVERSPIRLYRVRPDEARAECVHTFPQGGVQHVHGIYRDPLDDALWCLTGDVEGECRFLRSGNGFESFETIGAGDETWRALSPIFTDDAIYYAMDAEISKNRVFRFERATGARTELGGIDGPVYYTVHRDEDYFFAVTAELCPSQEGRNATLWHYRPGPDAELAPMLRIEKDRWPIQLLPGTLHFPSGAGLPGRFFFTGVALAGADGRVFEARRTEALR